MRNIYTNALETKETFYKVLRAEFLLALLEEEVKQDAE